MPGRSRSPDQRPRPRRPARRGPLDAPHARTAPRQRGRRPVRSERPGDCRLQGTGDEVAHLSETGDEVARRPPSAERVVRLTVPEGQAAHEARAAHDDRAALEDQAASDDQAASGVQRDLSRAQTPSRTFPRPATSAARDGAVPPAVQLKGEEQSSTAPSSQRDRLPRPHHGRGRKDPRARWSRRLCRSIRLGEPGHRHQDCSSNACSNSTGWRRQSEGSTSPCVQPSLVGPALRRSPHWE